MLSLREMEYVAAARTVGAGSMRIIFRHVLPNAIGPILVQTTFLVTGAILTEASLSFLGLGINMPTASWAVCCFPHSRCAHWSKRPGYGYPGVMIVIAALSINFIGDALRDAFDPRMVI